MGTDPEWSAHEGVVADVRRIVRHAQVRLLAEPDPTDPWWFLVDPDAWTEDAEWDH